MTVRSAIALLALVLSAARLAAAPLIDDVRYDAAIPTFHQVLGYDPGDEITAPDRIVAYLEALHAAAPDRTRLVEYGRTWEGRPLVLFIVGSPERIARLEAVQADIHKLADPRTLAPGDADRLVRELPVVAWLMHAVHGNEISSSDAALYEAYHLLAAQGDATVDAIRREVLALIDPLQNPDGRARFLVQNLFGRAMTPDPHRLAAEHDEPWPGGRANHYLFDMNRDWFAHTQRETQGRVKIGLTWTPQVSIDLHEMGGESTYYFAPPADPINPYLTPAQNTWLERFGRANAARFDAAGFPYFVREVYDEFYPGYGDSWPAYQGAIGMTFEMASARGLVLKREDDDTLLRYRDGVLRHFTAALTTLATAAANREQLLRDFLEFRRSAISDGERIAPREYVLIPGADRSRARHLADLLASQGIEVRQTSDPLAATGRTIPPGAYVVSAAQPAGRLVRNLLEPHVAQPEAFVREQDRRRKKRLSDQFYDVTAWNLPALYDVEVVTLDRPTAARTAPFQPAHTAPALPPAKVGYLLPWGFDTAAVVTQALATDVRVRQASQPFTLAGRKYAAGTAIVRVSENDQAALARFAALAGEHPAVEVVPIDTGWPDAGISLGSGDVVALKRRRVLLAWDAPTNSGSAGWARFVLERRFGQPVSAVRVSSLGRADLQNFDVIVLPSGNYAGAIGDDDVRRLKDWVRHGGTLVAIADAARWAANTKVGLLDAPTEMRDGRPESEEKDADSKDGAPKQTDGSQPFDYEKAIQPDRERPENTPGALMRVVLDTEHWLSAGHDGEVQTIVEGQRVFTPITLDKGRNAGVFATKDRLVAGGLAWDEARDQLAQKAYLVDQPLGRGHVVAFAEDPNYRAFSEGTELLFMNAVLLGPSY